MDYTDRDTLTNEEYDAKHKAEIKAYKDKQIKYSRNDLLSFGKAVYDNAHILGKSIEKVLIDWEKSSSVKEE